MIFDTFFFFFITRNGRTNNKIGQNEEATIYKDQIVKYN